MVDVRGLRQLAAIGSNMRRVLAIAVAGAGLAGLLGGCSSFSVGSITDYFKSAPQPIQVQIESTPPGADAATALGPGCKTPCSISVSPADNTFTVTYTLNRFQQATVPVNVTRNPGDFSNPATATIDPNPVFAELQPAVPSTGKGTKPKAVKKKKAVASDTASPSSEPNVAAPAGASR
jgi:hypothetical protein